MIALLPIGAGAFAFAIVWFVLEADRVAEQAHADMLARLWRDRP